MTQGSYKQFCPVAMAAEVLCTRWTIVVLRELIAGTTRFNDLRRGVPRMSPALLSQRLKELEASGVIMRKAMKKEAGVYEYHLTAAGHDLKDVVMGMGNWGQRWIKSELSLQHLDAQLLMWDMRRNLDTQPMPESRSVISFQYPDQSSHRSWWLVVEPETGTDLCSIDPGFDIDLYVSSDLKTMTSIWMGLDTVRNALSSNRLLLTGDKKLARNMQTWLGLSPFAKEKSLVG